MSDEKVTHERIENVFKPVENILQKLPDCIESREARRLVDVLTDLVHQSIEKAERVR